MTRPPLIIDVHGHYTTAPAALGDWRNLQIKALTDPTVIADPNSLHISDDELRDSISQRLDHIQPTRLVHGAPHW
jgi:4-oxalmesaconate hydratase